MWIIKKSGVFWGTVSWVAKTDDAQKFLSEMSAHREAIRAKLAGYRVVKLMSKSDAAVSE